MKRLLFILIPVLGLCACGKDSSSVSGPVEIALAAAIQSGTAQTKAPFELNVPTVDNPVTAAIWASTTSQSYQGTQSKEPGPEAEFIDYHNSTCFTGGKKQLLDHQLFYPENKKYVYFVGFCPRSEGGWQVFKEHSDSTKYNVAHHIFDGKTDVMASSEVKNNIESSAAPTLNFRHVLTWIRFKVVADNSDAIAAWGKVNKITIESNSKIMINVSKDSCTFDTKTDLPTYCTSGGKYTDTPFKSQAVELTTDAQEIAYVLCAAVDAGPNDGENEYSITIDTEYRPDTRVSLNLKAADGSTNFSGNTEGCQFTVTLRFKLGENIVTTARATEWQNAGVGVTSVGEK